MSMLTLYHGSENIIQKPEFGKGKPYNDYGQGFYCTKHPDLAKEWACTSEGNGFVNQYKIETSGLSVLNLLDDKYSILNWLAVLLKNREIRMSSPIEKKGTAYLLKHFLPSTERKDIIIGYRADDSYFSFARTFLANTITVEQLRESMMLGDLGEQYMLKSRKAFAQIQFVGYEIAESNIYYPKRKMRDETAREEFQKILNGESKGIYLHQIMEKGMTANDFKL